MTDKELFDKVKRAGEYIHVTEAENPDLATPEGFFFLWERVPDDFLTEFGDGAYLNIDLINPTRFRDALKGFFGKEVKTAYENPTNSE